MPTPATSRIGTSSPLDATTGIIRLACDVHSSSAVAQGWIVKPYDGPEECFFCCSARRKNARLERINP